MKQPTPIFVMGVLGQWCGTCFCINVKAWALLEDEATSFNPFALLSTTYVLLHGRSWMMKPHASILLPIHLESSRSSAVLSVSFEMQLVCIYSSCLHRWTSTLRSTWIHSPFRIPWMKSSNTCISVCDVSSCAWMWLLIDIDFTREKDELDFIQCVLSSDLFVFEHFTILIFWIDINMNNLFYDVLYHSWIFWIIIIASSFILRFHKLTWSQFIPFKQGEVWRSRIFV